MRGRSRCVAGLAAWVSEIDFAFSSCIFAIYEGYEFL